MSILTINFIDLKMIVSKQLWKRSIRTLSHQMLGDHTIDRYSNIDRTKDIYNINRGVITSDRKNKQYFYIDDYW